MKDACIIFDLDGTLVDTAPDLFHALDHTLAIEQCPPANRTSLRPLISRGARRMIKQALLDEGREVNDAKLDQLLAHFIDFYGDNIAVDSVVFPGVTQALEKLADSGARLGVCTNKRERLSVQLLKALQLESLFSTIVGVDTLEVHKPHPGHIFGTIKRLHGMANRAIMVGDSETDINAARAANIPVIAVPFGYSDQPVESLCPDIIVHHYDDLSAAVERLLAL